MKEEAQQKEESITYFARALLRRDVTPPLRGGSALAR